MEDDGPGIPAEDHERIFQMFETSPSSNENNTISSGLGLPIAKLAVERTMEELKEMQRQQASSIVVPGRENNKIQMP